jgi:hypothetical protein
MMQGLSTSKKLLFIASMLQASVFIGFGANAHAKSQGELLFTGEIASADEQIIAAPMTDSWQVQIQWMHDEGTIVNKGELAVLFEAGSIKNQIQQNEERLAAQQLVLKKRTNELKQAVVEAEGRLNVAKLQVEQAQIEASITSKDIPKYDQGKYKLALERALVEKIKAQENLKVTQQNYQVGVEKQKIEMTKIEESLLEMKTKLARTSVKAQLTYMMHPWQRMKITAGSTVQQSMKVAKIQGAGGYQVKGWLHEIDVNKVKVGDTANISLDAHLGKSFEATIVSVASQSEPKPEWSESHYHEVLLSFNQQPTVKLLPGMSTRVQMLSASNGQGSDVNE